MKQVLHQPEGAQEAADGPTQDHAEEHKHPQHVEGNVMLGTQSGLQGPDGAGPQSSGAGVAV